MAATLLYLCLARLLGRAVYKLVPPTEGELQLIPVFGAERNVRYERTEC